MRRRDLLPLLLAPSLSATSPTRRLWIAQLDRIARPVLENLAANRLKLQMPVRAGKPEWAEQRRPFATLEAFGRTSCGIAPWLETSSGDVEEQNLRARFRAWADAALANAVDPQAPDYLAFRRPGQSLVDASFLALALLRAPSWFTRASAATRSRIFDEFRATRATKPGFNNWLLFSAMIETFLLSHGQDWDRMRVDYAIRQHMQWYKGDGHFGDGPDFHWDYYNSYVIQPYLTEILTRLESVDKSYTAIKTQVERIALRYAAIQERLISPQGEFPLIGRSIAYRTGAFHHLAHQALRQMLPVPPAQVRCALTALHQKVWSYSNFDRDGWLEVGVAGPQPGLGDSYINTGSLYLTTFSYLPLGLPPESPFWLDPDTHWTQKLLWNGSDLPGDHALRVP